MLKMSPEPSVKLSYREREKRAVPTREIVGASRSLQKDGLWCEQLKEKRGSPENWRRGQEEAANVDSVCNSLLRVRTATGI